MLLCWLDIWPVGEGMVHKVQWCHTVAHVSRTHGSWLLLLQLNVRATTLSLRSTSLNKTSQTQSGMPKGGDAADLQFIIKISTTLGAVCVTCGTITKFLPDILVAMCINGCDLLL